jgi:hypothetical protein
MHIIKTKERRNEMTVLAIARKGNEVKTIPMQQVTIKADGTIWISGMPLLNGDKTSQEDRVALNNKKYALIRKEAYAILGDNGNGLWIGDYAEYKNRPEIIAAEKAKADHERRTVKIYLSSRGWGDYSPVEWIGDITRPTNEILAECREALEKGYDVDTPDKADTDIIMDIEAAQNRYNNQPVPVKEPERGPGYCYNCETYCYGDCGNYAPKPTKETFKRHLDEMTREANYGIND